MVKELRRLAVEEAGWGRGGRPASGAELFDARPDFLDRSAAQAAQGVHPVDDGLGDFRSLLCAEDPPVRADLIFDALSLRQVQRAGGDPEPQGAGAEHHQAQRFAAWTEPLQVWVPATAGG